MSSFRWSRTNAPMASSRTDDIWFVNEDVGWAVNSNGQILKTTDGFQSFEVQAHLKGNYLRCVGFAPGAQVGWVGTLDREQENQRLFSTTERGELASRDQSPGGSTWAGMRSSVVDDQTLFISGTNYPNEPSSVVKTTDGGASWDVLDLGLDTAILVDVYFADAMNGWVVGGADVVKHPGRTPLREDVVPIVLHTTDGGHSWSNAVTEIAHTFPQGEWGWKFFALDASTLFVALENFHDGAILRSDDGGANWRRVRINDRQRNGNLEGIGFVDANTGWVGGWGDFELKGGFTSSTADGGDTWDDANEVGFRINRFRFIGSPVRRGYASGATVYCYSDREVDPQAAQDEKSLSWDRPLVGDAEVEISFDVPEGTRQLRVDVWEHFGRYVGRILDETTPGPGRRTLDWDFRDLEGAEVPTGGYLVRVTADDDSVSHLVIRSRTAPPR